MNTLAWIITAIALLALAGLLWLACHLTPMSEDTGQLLTRMEEIRQYAEEVKWAR